MLNFLDFILFLRDFYIIFVIISSIIVCYNLFMTLKRIVIIMISISVTLLSTACSTISYENENIEHTQKPTQAPNQSITQSPTQSSFLVTANPTQTPAPSAMPTEKPTPVSFRFSILAAGDVMAHGDNLKSAYNPEDGTYSFIENYAFVKEIIESADLSICNLETVTAGASSDYTSYPRFNTPVEILDGLKYAGFDILVTANNHSLDRGETGITKTINAIHNRGMLTTGSYIEPGLNYLTTEIKNKAISILAYTQHLNGNLPLLPDDKHYMINQMERDSIISDIETASRHSDLVIVYLHWGNEYTRGIEDWQPEYAHALINAGADVILGTHPHVVRPDEIYIKDGEPKYIIYSMGNYISNFIREDNRTNAIYTEDGVMIKLNFLEDNQGKIQLESVIPIPTWPYKFINETGIHYEIIPVVDSDLIVHAVPYANDQAKDSYYRTMESLTGFNLND